MRVLIALLLAAAVSAFPQTSRRGKGRVVPAAKPAPATRWPVGSITVEGNRNYPTDRILRVAGVSVGQTAGRAEFDAAQARLLATGLFDRVDYRFEPSTTDPQKYAATFTVSEIAQVYPFRTEELGIDDKPLERWIAEQEPLAAPKIPATEQTLARYSEHVEQYLAKQGKPMKVVGRLSPEANGLTVIFRPANLPSVAEIYFKGNQSIDMLTLQKAAAGAGVGAVYTERRFRQVLDNSVRPLYEAQGRLRVSFPKLETAKAKTTDGIAVTATVDEGAVYKLGTVTVAGAEGRRQVARIGKVKSGEVANFTEIDSGIDNLLTTLRKDGFIRAAAKTDRQVDDKEHKVDIVVNITPGPQFIMGKLNIEGLDIQTEPAVRKLWAVKEGKPFNGEYPEFFLKRLREDGIFENLGKTHSEVKLDEQALRADVTLRFGKGTPLQQIGPNADIDQKRR